MTTQSSSGSPLLPLPGETIGGKYRVEHTLGQGGMGIVVAARHVVLGRLVAIKLMTPSMEGEPAGSARFLREARALTAIDSEHVTSILDAGTTETGARYLVMEYLTGRDLRQHLHACGQLRVAEAVGLILQAAEGVAAAHQKGIIHRDLKPANLFLTRGPSGSPLLKVIDFGIAKTMVPESNISLDLTLPGLLMGSPHYMSPEQFRNLSSADARSDVWALGVILYEMLTGLRPFNGNGFSAISLSVFVDEPTPIWRHRSALSARLDAVVRRCLAKDRAHRIQSAEYLRHELLPFQTGMEAPSNEPTMFVHGVPVVSSPRAATAAVGF